MADLFPVVFFFLRNFHTVLHNDYIGLHSHQQYRGPPFSPHPLQHLLFVDFIMMVILTGVKWYLTVVQWYLPEVIPHWCAVIPHCISVKITDVEHLFPVYRTSVCLIWRNVCFKKSWSEEELNSEPAKHPHKAEKLQSSRSEGRGAEGGEK